MAPMTPMTLMELMAGYFFINFRPTSSLLFWESVLVSGKRLQSPENNFSKTPNTKLEKNVTRHEHHERHGCHECHERHDRNKTLQ